MKAVRAAAVAAAVVTGAVVGALPAEAHTSLTDATPGKGDTVASPARVKLTFTDPVRFPGLVVLDSAKHHHESGRPHAVDNTVTATIAGTLAPGVYTVGWRVVAPDGHPVTGDYRFTVKGTAAAPVTQAPTRSASPSARPAESGSGTSWWWVGLGVLVVAAAAGGVALLRRRG